MERKQEVSEKLNNNEDKNKRIKNSLEREQGIRE
jgi:hypothetical protein